MRKGRGGIYAAVAAIAGTVGLGAVGAAGADQAADGHVYARGDGVTNCFSDDSAATQCATGETADVTINAGEKVTFHFEPSVQHNAVGSSWQAPPSGYASPGSTYDVTFPNGGDYEFVCGLHPMSGTIHVIGATPSPSPTPTPTPSTQPSGPITPAPSGSTDTLKPKVSSVRPKALRRAVRVRFTLSEPATVTVRIKRARKIIKSARVQAMAGARSVTLRSKRLKKGRYTVEVSARDTAGNRSVLASKRVTLRK